MRKYFCIILAVIFWISPIGYQIQAKEFFKQSLLESWKQGFIERLRASLPEPKVQQFLPEHGSENISPLAIIEVSWDQPVDPDSFFAHLSVSPDFPNDQGREIRLSWNYQKNPGAFQIQFLPHLPTDTAVTVRISPGVKSLFGKKQSNEEVSSTFSTAGIVPLKALPLFEKLQGDFPRFRQFLLRYLQIID